VQAAKRQLSKVTASNNSYQRALEQAKKELEKVKKIFAADRSSVE